MRRRPVRLIAWILAVLAAPAMAAPQAEVVGTFVWTKNDRAFGGISGFDLYPDGLRFRAITDRGRTLAGTLIRDGEGRVTRVDSGPLLPLMDIKGVRYDVDEVNIDAEGLALGPGRSFFVSFEINHRINFYLSEGAATYFLTGHEDFRAFDDNEGFEALAGGDDGSLWAIPEVMPGGGNRPVWRFDGQWWSVPFHLPPDGNWKITGADVGPDGLLYLVERDYWGFVGFMSRVVRYDLTPGQHQPQVLLESRAGQFDNLESIAAWKDSQGAVRLTLVSDDNFMPFQKTQIVDLRVRE
jgi:hypothetical protein